MIFKVSNFYIIHILIVSIIIGVLPYFEIKILQNIINRVQSEFEYNEIVMLCVGYIFIDMVLLFASMLKRYLDSNFKFKLNRYISVSILEKAEKLKLENFETSDSYNVISRAQNSNRIFEYLSCFIEILQNLITLTLYIKTVFYWKWYLAVPLIMTSFIIGISTEKINVIRFKTVKNRTEKEREKWYYQFILTNNLTIKEIKVNRLFTYFISKFIKIYDGIVKEDKEILEKEIKKDIRLNIIEKMEMTFVLIFIVKDAVYGKILIGDVLAFISIFSAIKSHMNGLIIQFSEIFDNNLYIDQLFEYFDLKEENKVFNQLSSSFGKIRNIKIENLSFKYKNSTEYVLKNINLTICENDHLAIVGKNGSGKSTLLKILLGLYDDYEGNVYINGVEIRNIEKEKLYSQISILFQDYTKYELSVRENICCSCIEYQQENSRIYQALEKIDANKKIYNLDKRLGCYFENGIQLSGGEWLKIGLARIFFKEANLILLDEPNAALDPISEQEVLKKIKKETEGKISIIITHKFVNIPLYANRIVVMNQGKIEGDGKHEELIRKCNMYDELYNASLKEL